MVIGLQNEHDVFNGHHHRQRPENQGHHPQDIGLGEGHGVRAVKAFLDRVQRTGADVAINYTRAPRARMKFLYRSFFSGWSVERDCLRGAGNYCGRISLVNLAFSAHKNPQTRYGRSRLRIGPEGFSPSPPTRLAAGLGPMRLSYAKRRCAPKTRFPRIHFLMEFGCRSVSLILGKFEKMSSSYLNPYLLLLSPHLSQ